MPWRSCGASFHTPRSIISNYVNVSVILFDKVSAEVQLFGQSPAEARRAAAECCAAAAAAAFNSGCPTKSSAKTGYCWCFPAGR